MLVGGIGWSLRHGLEVAPGEPGAGRTDYAQVVLEARQTLSLQVGAGTSRTTQVAFIRNLRILSS